MTNKKSIVNKANNIKIAGVISYISIFFGILTLLLYTPWMIDKIGKSDYGIYTLALSLINIFVFDFGLSKSVNKELSENVVKDQYKQVNNITGIFYKLYLIISVVISFILILLYFLIPGIYKTFNAEELIKLKKIFIIISIYSVISFAFIPQNGILQSYQEFIYLKTADLMFKIISTLLIVASLLMGKGLYGVVLSTTLTGLIIIIYKEYLIRHKLKVKPNFKYWNKHDFKEITKTSLWSALISFSQRFIFTISPLIIGALLGPEAVAVFGIISSIEGNFYVIGVALNGFFLTRTTNNIFKDNYQEIEKDLTGLTYFTMFFIGLILYGLIVLGESFINLWIGQSYSDAYLGIVLVIIPTFIYLPHQISIDVIMVKNKLKYQGIIYFLMAVINIILSFFLIRYLGVIGASIAIFVSYTFRNIAMGIIFVKNMEINWKKYFLNGYIKMLIPLVISILVGFIVVNGRVINTIGKLIVWIVILTLIYIMIHLINFLIMIYPNIINKKGNK